MACEHAYNIHTRAGRPDVRVCIECCEPDWEHLAAQLAKPAARRPGIVGRILGYAIGIPALASILVATALLVGIGVGLLWHALRVVWGAA